MTLLRFLTFAFCLLSVSLFADTASAHVVPPDTAAHSVERAPAEDVHCCMHDAGISAQCHLMPAIMPTDGPGKDCADSGQALFFGHAVPVQGFEPTEPLDPPRSA